MNPIICLKLLITEEEFLTSHTSRSLYRNDIILIII